MSIVSTDKNYSYTTLYRDLATLNYKYPFLNIQIAGNSVLGKNLFVVKLGKGSKKVFYTASFHANEWITSVVMMKFIEDYCEAYANNSKLYGYSVRNLFNNTSIYIMPMVNPDGVDLVTDNLSKISYGYLNALNIANQFPNIPFVDGWKANINGVDLKNYQPFCKVL